MELRVLKASLLAGASSILMAVAASPASAQPVGQTGPLNGLYGGLQIGHHSFGQNTWNRLSAESNEFPFSSASLDMWTDVSLRGVGGGPFVGYGRRYGNWWLAGEAEFNFSGATGNNNLSATVFQEFSGTTTADVNTRIRARESFGLSALAGYMPMPGTTLFTRVGWQYGRFHVKSSIEFEGESVGIIDQGKWASGFRWGVGANVNLGPIGIGRGAALRLEWNHTSYEKLEFSRRFVEGKNSFEQRDDFAPRESLFRVGLAIGY